MSRKANLVAGALVCVLIAALTAQVFAQGPDKADPSQAEDLPKAVAQLKERVDELERALDLAKKERAKQADTISELSRDTTNLTRRVENLDRNDLAQVKRDVEAAEKSIDDLNKRVRRLE